jgi:hypothetical protein
VALSHVAICSCINIQSVAQSQAACEAFSGQFSTDPSTNQLGTGTLIWSCLGYNDDMADYNNLSVQCSSDGGTLFGPAPTTLTQLLDDAAAV